MVLRRDPVRHWSAWLLVGALAVTFLAACATAPYEFGSGIESGGTLPLRPDELQMERGRPHRLLDGLGHYVLSLPSKLILLNWQVDNHAISAEIEQALCVYLEENDLLNTKIRLNQYAPGNEWSRLVRNRNINGFWRYTVGVLTVAVYTALPQRAFGGDNYNPFTNTVNLYSDDRAIALHEAGHAKDFAQRDAKGFYAALRILPLVPLFQEAKATGDAIGYERVLGGSDDEKHAYRALYPAYGTYLGGEAARWVAGPFWVPYALAAAGAVPGHVIGWVRSLFVPDRPAPDARTRLPSEDLEQAEPTSGCRSARRRGTE